jgi:predicted restriction endonuclease
MERWAWVKQRAHQMALRKVILEERHGKCQVTALGIRELLEACHIVPYCEGKEQWNPDNALLLAVHIHALFDAHLISFDETGKIMISDCLTPGERAILGLREDMQLAGHERHQIFLTNHMVLLKQPEPSLT